MHRGERGQVHSEIAAVPAERLEIERTLLGELPQLRARIGKVVLRKVDRLSCVRFDSARYSVPDVHVGRQVEVRVADGEVMVVLLGEIIVTHDVVAPGEAGYPRRALRGRTARPPPGGPAQDRDREGLRRPRARSPRPSSRGRPPGA